jgi:uncharacterized protein YbjQ (UPF0145 family)
MNSTNILLTTTSSVDLPGAHIEQYLGLVTGDTIIGAHMFKDIFAGLRDIFGGRSGTYERVLQEAREAAITEILEQARGMGANAVIGLKLDFGSVGANNSMLMVSATGTAVRFVQ